MEFKVIIKFRMISICKISFRNKDVNLPYFALVWYFPGENITDAPINKGISRLGGLDGTNKHGSEDGRD
ncbi:unnamed protein product [Rhizophagus irregularis]|nr:unnamed protein product [Rhizophagus irregularis]CAB4418106.1 unnamed protein product [Rhizophagus irregularis]